MAHAHIRPICLEDVDGMMTWVNNPDVVRNFQNFDKQFTRKEEIVYLEKMLASPNDRLFAIETENGDYIGNVGLHGISSKNKLGRLALIIGRQEYRGRGYGQSAVREALRYAFENYRLNKVWLVVFKENERAQHVYEKTGFNVEGILRQEYADRDERFHDMVRMAILRGEYFDKYYGQGK